MLTLPQLIEDDVRTFQSALDGVLSQSEATVAMILDKGGFLVAQRGRCEDFDTVSLGALAAGSFAATQSIAGLVGEPNFSSIYQQGENNSVLVVNVDDFSLLAVVFPATISVGVVKFYALQAVKLIAGQMLVAKLRNPDGGIDLSMLDMADTAPVFARRAM